MEHTKKEIITIAGRPGSGKSTTAKCVATLLEYTHFSSGDLFREISRELGHNDVLKSNVEAEKEAGVPVIDQRVDQRLRELGTTANKMVIDSRTAWHWIPDSFQVFLQLDLHTAAKRILSDMTPERIAAENIPNSPEEYATQLEQRLASESRRYKKLYGIDPYDVSNYDLVIDTKTNGIEEVAQLIVDQYRTWQNS